MNQKLFIAALISLGLVAVVSISAVVWQMTRPGPAQQPTDQNPFGGLGGPGGTSTTTGATGTLTVPSHDGSPVETKDFIHNGETATDDVNPGSYVLAGELGYCRADGVCPHGAETSKFTITYAQEDGIFNVILLEEPLGEARAEAEAFLTSRLGLSSEQLCSLRHEVSTPYWVNSVFAGLNLGFSSCTGATELP